MTPPLHLRTSSSSITRTWRFADVELVTGKFPLIMGIVNVTPDSFSDGGSFIELDKALAHARELVAQGADILDIGGESTRPGAEPVDEVEELRRVIPVIRELSRQVSVPLSIDTTKARVAVAALASGATIVNDISGLTFDPDMVRVCSGSDAGVVCMHIQGTPQTMQAAPAYDDVVTDVVGWLSRRLDVLAERGIEPQRVCLDPGIGFGKTAEHNLALLSHISEQRALGRPVCIGHSRKRFLKSILKRPLDERSYGTAGVSVALAQQHADILRVHDVTATRDTLLAWHTVAQQISS